MWQNFETYLLINWILPGCLCFVFHHQNGHLYSGHDKQSAGQNGQQNVRGVSISQYISTPSKLEQCHPRGLLKHTPMEISTKKKHKFYPPKSHVLLNICWVTRTFKVPYKLPPPIYPSQFQPRYQINSRVVSGNNDNFCLESQQSVVILWIQEDRERKLQL